MWACASTSMAHFLWLKTIEHEGKPHAFLFFGESAQDEAYHLPVALTNSKVWRRSTEGDRRALEMKSLETDERIGLAAALQDAKPCVLEASERYGVYGTALLVYSAKHVHASSVDQFNAAGASNELPLDIVPKVNGDEVRLTVLWEGKPLAGADVSIAVGDAQPTKKKTNDQGQLSFAPEGDGVISALANRMDRNLTGELQGKSYDHGLHYSSLTFGWPIDAKTENNATSANDARAELPQLPEPLSSFGAAVADGWLYVYGGHIGTEHEHSAANLSKHFRRIRLGGIGPADGKPKWEELPMQTPLQGLAIVAHGGKIYRIGGMNALNATIDEEEDLRSTAEFAEFDPRSGKWTPLAPLPAPRSSHNAVVIGGRIYVVGGWALSGSSPGDWQHDALVYDLSDPPLGRELGAERQGGWQTLPEPPFTRRALAAGHWNGKLVAIGGLDENGDVSHRVDLFDLGSGQWTEGPNLPGEAPAGFGASAWNLDGRLYVSGIRGVLFRLSDDGSQWEDVGRLEKPRFFHQLLPSACGEGLLAVGGASRAGHIADIERINIEP